MSGRPSVPFAKLEILGEDEATACGPDGCALPTEPSPATERELVLPTYFLKMRSRLRSTSCAPRRSERGCRRGGGEGRSTERNGVVVDVPHPAVAGRDDVDSMAQRPRELVLHSAELEQACAGLDIDEQVDI